MARHYRSLDENDGILWMLVVAKNDRHVLQPARERVYSAKVSNLFGAFGGSSLKRTRSSISPSMMGPGRASHPLVAISEVGGGKAVTSEL
jgi:hypothetical protein